MSVTPTPLRHERTTDEWATAATVLSLGLKALNQRALVWTAAISAGAGWGFTIIHPEPFRIVAATLGCATVLLPILFRDRRGE
jgi:hypothetical protein